MLGVVNRYWKHIVRSADDFFNKWLVTYEELPRDEEKFPGDSLEFYPDYIGVFLTKLYIGIYSLHSDNYFSWLVPGGEPSHLSKDCSFSRRSKV